jgi:hypothetical protein
MKIFRVFRAQGFSVDDDNEPAPENIPTAADTAHDGLYAKSMGSEPFNARRVLGVRDVQPTLVSADASMHSLRLLPPLFASGVFQNNHS